ncbi:tRNA (adenosine(37)-N6)-threonylcarbamoyltransferase complex transferase subunit TsaD [Candidatus Daviesbacteria bacterium]|nr:tRNA (adenosine(37)-N6)-threonylcarbamoyltransferase complex transferase subunit TsaD [Candidatus Daviesbacteria bacterium]
MYKTILGIETSCDETAAAVLSFDPAQDKQKGIRILSNIVASSAAIQSKYGGIIPEQAAREQLKSIIPVIQEAINESRLTINEIDAIAVTFGPGLIGSLLVGVETAKTLALVWNKPLIPVNHLVGHFYANFIDKVSKEGKVSEVSNESTQNPPLDTFGTFDTSPTFPIIGLLVSGGHTDLVLFTDHNKYQYLGGTRDDAAGECFDKCARLLGLPYPGGPEISKLAATGDASKIKLPKPMTNSKDLDFSFSGLKTAVANYIDKNKNYKHKDLAASIEQTIIESLMNKTLQAVKEYGINQVMIAGGVAANQALSEALRKSLHVRVFSPSHNIFCTDNASMIAAAGFFSEEITKPLDLQANPNLSL